MAVLSRLLILSCFRVFVISLVGLPEPSARLLTTDDPARRLVSLANRCENRPRDREDGSAHGQEESGCVSQIQGLRASRTTSPKPPKLVPQAAFEKKQPPVTGSDDSSLVPARGWDGRNSAREQEEVILANLGQPLGANPVSTARSR